ncbi:MAG: hypothetical protein ACREKL_09260 [Chthoniobacterales bacterium]
MPIRSLLFAFATVCICHIALAAKTAPDALSAALADARPGDTIRISGTHSGIFVTSVDGTAEAPITIEGDGSAVLTTDSKKLPVLKIQNDHYRVVNIATRGGEKGIYVTGAHGLLRGVDVSDTQEEGFTFKRSRARYWLVEDCTVRHAGLEGRYGEGFYVGDATGNWLSDQADTPGYITFYNCRTSDTVNDGWDIKEGAHHVKVVNCTADLSTSAPLPATSLEFDHTGAYCRADHVQFINFRVQNLRSGRDLTAVRLFTQKGRDGAIYGSNMDLKKIAAAHIPQGALLYVNASKMSVRLFDDYKLADVGAFLADGSAEPETESAGRFSEMTWPGEGGEILGNRSTQSGAIATAPKPPASAAPKVVVIR